MIQDAWLPCWPKIGDETVIWHEGLIKYARIQEHESKSLNIDGEVDAGSASVYGSRRRKTKRVEQIVKE